MATFVSQATDRALSDAARQALKMRILDAIACAFGALQSPLVPVLRAQVDDFGGRPLSTLIGGGRTSPDRAAFFNGALVRYLDFSDSYLAKGETCHPSDNFAPVLAAAEYANATGRTLLAALAVAYQVQCRLSDEAPVRARGFDHVTQGAIAVAAGVSRALGLDTERTAHALSMSATAHNALRITRVGSLSHWKGLAYAHASFAAMQTSFLAARGITAPALAFEGRSGWMDSIAGEFTIDWRSEDMERVGATAVKRFDGEIHGQSTVEAMIDLVRAHDLDASRIERITLDTFDVAYDIIGGGAAGNRTEVATREQADHSLPYMLAAAALDGALGPEQYTSDRIHREDVQRLLRRVTVREAADLSARFPRECPVRLRVLLEGGRAFEIEKADYCGYPSRPMSRSDVIAKFDRLSSSAVNEPRRARIVRAVEHIEELGAIEFAEFLADGGPSIAILPEPLTEEVQP